MISFFPRRGRYNIMATRIPYFSDSAYYPDFLAELGYDQEQLAQILMQIPLADRQARHMLYRGRSLARSKFFFVDSLDQIPIYSYPGFQYRSVLEEYRTIASQPQIAGLQEILRQQFQHTTNHVIGTVYRDGKDNIGWHTDKVATIDETIPIYIFSFLQPRPLAFKHQLTEAITEVPMKPGSLFVLGHQTNREYLHSIQPTKQPVSTRLSVIFRRIKNILPRTVVAKKV